MRDLINALFRWLARNVVTLIVVVAILIGGGFVKQQWEKFDLTNESKLGQLIKFREAIEKMRKEAEISVAANVPSQKATMTQIDGALRRIKNQLDKAKINRKELWDANPLERMLPISPVFLELVKMDIRIKLLEHADSYTNALYERALVISNARILLEKLRQDMNLLAADVQNNKHKQWVLSKAHPIAWHIPGTSAYKQMKRLEDEQVQLQKRLKVATRKYDDQNRDVSKKPPPLRPFVNAKGQVDGERQLAEEIKKVEQQLNDNLFQRADKPVTQVLPKALWIVFAIIVTPIAIKLFMFYVIAPLAARRPGIRLLPGSSGLIRFGANDEVKRTGSLRASTVSTPIILDDTLELLVHPEFLQSVSLAAKKETKWLLDWTMPLTSLASGMYGLTRVYPDGSEPVVISSSQDPLIEISEIDLPAGSAVVLQPRCLVGIVQRPGDPVRIKGYWRFGLSNWLTMQLRYVVFHGPARLIVKGCRGIRIELVNTGRAINQAAMLGFSANLQYAVTRCETFGSYLMGKQELFNDRFAGQPGCCIYEETPHPNAKAGVTGRGIEGILDSFLKVFGI